MMAPADVYQHIASFLHIRTLMRLASLSREFAGAIVAPRKRRWAAERVQSVFCGNKARRANPEVAFVRLAVRAMSQIVARWQQMHERSPPMQYVHFVLNPGDLVVTYCRSTYQIHFAPFLDPFDAESDRWVHVCSKDAVASLFEYWPHAYDALNAVVRAPCAHELGHIFNQGIVVCVRTDIFEEERVHR